MAVTQTGAGFTLGATVSVSGAGVSLAGLKVVDSTTITVKAPVSATAATGKRILTVDDANGSSACIRCLTTDAAVPSS